MLGHDPLSTRPLSTVSTGSAAVASGSGMGLGVAGITLVSEDPVYQRVDHAKLFAMFGRQTAAAVIAGTMLLFPTKAASVEAEQDTAHRTDHQSLHRFRTNYQTVGQPWVAIYPKPSVRVEAETYQPTSAKPFPSQIVSATAVGQPWSMLWQKSGQPPAVEQFQGVLSTSVVVTQQVTLTAGQPWSLLWPAPSYRVEAEGYSVSNKSDLNLFRTTYQTVGQPLSLVSWKSKNWDVASETYEVRTPVPTVHAFRTTYQTVGQPWQAFTTPKAPRVEAESYEVRKTPYFYQAANVVAQPGQPFSLLWLKTGQPPPVDTFMGMLSTSAVAEQHSITPASGPGQPFNLLYWQSQRQQMGPEVDFRVPDQTTLHAFRWPPVWSTLPFSTELVTLSEDYWYAPPQRSQDLGLLPFRQFAGPVLPGQPWNLLWWKTTRQDVEAEGFRPQPPADIGPYRWPTVIIVGQPYSMLSWTSTRQQMDCEQDFRVPQYSVHDYRPHQGSDVIIIPPPTSDVQQGSGGGGGGGKKRRHKPETWESLHPLQALDKLIDSAVAKQVYGDIQASTAPAAVKAEAQAVVKPTAAPIDWEAVQRDADKVGRLVALWQEVDRKQRLRRDEEDWLMLGD